MYYIIYFVIKQVKVIKSAVRRHKYILMDKSSENDDNSQLFFRNVKIKS